jgi:hypothetical protein
MFIQTIPAQEKINYSLEAIKNEIAHLVEKDIATINQPIYTLCQYIPGREWIYIVKRIRKI